MILRIIGNDFHYECENLCRIFYPNEKISVVYDYEGSDPLTVIAGYENGAVYADVDINGKKAFSKTDTEDERAELDLAVQIYKCLGEITGYTPPWGVLTGVRPSKLFIRLTEDMGFENAVNYFKNELLVNENKTGLTVAVAGYEKEIMDSFMPDGFSLYVSIPFCPSRCSYCSFVSHSIANANARRILPEYLEKLADEIKAISGYASSLNLKLENIYFGGGTPGVLEASQLDYLQCVIEDNFSLDYLKEYTVEIGRPDTVTPEKLRVLKLHNTDRISINPQTFNQKTLDAIGRKHTVEQAVEAYRLSRSYDFKCINTDFIAGLPGETPDDFRNSLDTAVMLAPENITVHTLSLKRSSNMNTQGAEVDRGAAAGEMLDYARELLTASGYDPYYMYRQSKCAGNLENVGWSRGETAGRYNVCMMEERQTVFAAGAGAVTKLCAQNGRKVERIFNYKYPFEYISGFDEIAARKNRIYDFYSEVNERK